MAKNKDKKAIGVAAAIAAAGLGLWYAIKSGMFGGSNKGTTNNYYYTTSDGKQGSSESWQNALISAGGQLGTALIEMIQTISQGKQGKQAEEDLKQVICNEYGVASTSSVTDEDVARYSNFVTSHGRKPTQEEFETQIWI